MPGRTQDATVLAAGHVERSGNTSEYRQAALRPAAPEGRRQYQITLAVLLILPLCMVLVVLLGPFAIQDFPSAALAPHMTPSLEIAWKLLPLYFVVAPGIVLGRLFEIGRVSIGTVLVRGVSPVVFFCAVASAPVTPHDLAMSTLFLLLPTVVCLAAFGVARAMLAEWETRLSAFLAGSANVGYFGVPAALAVLPAGALGSICLPSLGSRSTRTPSVTT